MSINNTYVISDLHGRYDLLEKALSLIPTGSKIIFTGDYIDRGPDSYKIIDRLMVGQYNKENWICLRGNHEQMMIDAIIYPDNMFIWRMNGGDNTEKSYPKNDAGAVFEYHAEWMNSLPYYHEDTHRVYVHAYLEPNTPLSKQNKDIMIWDRYDKREDYGWMNKHVVHGHTPNKEGPILYKNRTDLDTGAVYTGRLVVGVFDDNVAGGPIDLIEVVINDVGKPTEGF
jgi:serine/threonine protein phosphatase 1